MFIKNGATRHVVLVGPYAIKIARTTPLYVVFEEIKYIRNRLSKNADYSAKNCSGETIESLTFFRRVANICKRLKRRLVQARHHIGLGVKANKAEFNYWSTSDDERCIPTHGIYCFGLILVQARGKSMTQSELFRSSARQHTKDPELYRANQWSWFEGRPRIVDYAHLGDPSVLFSNRAN